MTVEETDKLCYEQLSLHVDKGDGHIESLTLTFWPKIPTSMGHFWQRSQPGIQKLWLPRKMECTKTYWNVTWKHKYHLQKTLFHKKIYSVGFSFQSPEVWTDTRYQSFGIPKMFYTTLEGWEPLRGGEELRSPQSWAGPQSHHRLIVLHDRQGDGQAEWLRDRMEQRREKKKHRQEVKKGSGHTERSTEKWLRRDKWSVSLQVSFISACMSWSSCRAAT